MNIAMDLMRPITPQQARDRTTKVDARLIAVVNQLIVEFLFNDRASLDLDLIAKRYCVGLPNSVCDFSREHVQAIAALYRERGWQVSVSEVEIDRSEYKAVLLFVLPPDTRKPPSKAKIFAIRALTIGVVGLYVYLMWELAATLLP